MKIKLTNILMALLFLCLIGLGVVTFFTAGHLVKVRADLKETKEEVASLHLLVDQLSQEASSEADAAAKEPHPTTSDAPLSDETEEAISEGTLSPASSEVSPFDPVTDATLTALMAQVEGQLPADNGNWAVYTANLTSGGEASINNARMQAASLIKLFIMGAVYENYFSLTAQYGETALMNSLTAMITVSDNEAANTLTRWLGGGDETAGRDVVNKFCLSHGYLSTHMGRMLLASNAADDNYTSVEDCGRFLREIYLTMRRGASGTLSNCPAMFSLLSQQQLRNKIPAQMPSGVSVASKTGELSNVENDAAILTNTAKGVDLVVVFMSENLGNSGAAQGTIASVSRMIYGYYNE